MTNNEQVWLIKLCEDWGLLHLLETYSRLNKNMKVYLLYISKLLKLFKLKGGKYIAEKKKFEIKFLENFKK